MGVLYCPGPGVLKYKTELVAVIKGMLTACKGKRGYKWAGKILRNLLMTLLNIYPLEIRGVPPQEWKNQGML